MRLLLDTFDAAFQGISAHSISLLELTSEDDLYRRPRELPKTFTMFSIGEYILRSAATVEQTFGGITTRLWDDPFEWTLPEKLYSVALIMQYLGEVDETRKAGIAHIANDNSLAKQILAPVEIKPIAEILIQTIARAEHFQGRAYAVFQMLSNQKLPKP